MPSNTRMTEMAEMPITSQFTDATSVRRLAMASVGGERKRVIERAGEQQQQRPTGVRQRKMVEVTAYRGNRWVDNMPDAADNIPCAYARLQFRNLIRADFRSS